MKSIILKGRNSGNRPSGRFNSNNSNNHSYKSIKPLPLRGKLFTKANLTELLSELIVESHELEDSPFASENVEDNKESTLLVNSTTASKLNPGDIRKLLSTPAKSSQSPSSSSAKKVACKTDITINSKVYREVGKHVIYYLSKVSRSSVDSLVDIGANGGVAGNDVRAIAKHPDRTVDVRGIDNHEITSIPLVTVGGVTSTTSGEIIIIMHQYAHHGKNKTIHSSPQIEHYENKVDDRSIKVGGSQHITTLDNYKIPMSIRNALPYMLLRPYTDSEWEALPHIVLTSDKYWDPTVLDCEGQVDNEIWYDAQSSFPDGPHNKLFDEVGDYRLRSNNHQLFFFNAETFDEHNHDDVIHIIMCCNNVTTKSKEPDYDLLKPVFNWTPLDMIKKTFQLSTQCARTPASSVMKKTYRSPFPGLNVKRRSEPVAICTVYCDTPVVDDGSTCAQLFVETKTFLTDVYGMKSDKQFVNSLEDNIRQRGAMDKLISDSAQSEISTRVKDILRDLFIDDWQSEAHHQHQNYAEKRHQTVKRQTNTLLDRTGAPSFTWLLAMCYVCFVLNHTYNATIKTHL